MKSCLYEGYKKTVIAALINQLRKIMAKLNKKLKQKYSSGRKYQKVINFSLVIFIRVPETFVLLPALVFPVPLFCFRIQNWSPMEIIVCS